MRANTVPDARRTTPATERRVVIAAGGTGGHFFPAEALATALLHRGIPFALLTDGRGGGTKSRIFADHPIHVLHGAGIAGRGLTQAARAGVALTAGTWQARAALRGLHPAAIVGFGGYPTLAPVLGGRLLRRRIPVILHEQNAVLGRTNRALARRATALALSVAHTRGVPDGLRTVLTGNPVRPAFVALAGRPYVPPGAEGPIRLLVLGGSLGAHVMSTVVPSALAGLPEALRQRLAIAQQCRAEDLTEVHGAYAASGVGAVLDSFFPHLAGLLDTTHLVIARAGASTIAELAVVGRPAILVPLPTAIDDHQSANAAALDGAWQLPQASFTPEALARLLENLLADPALLSQSAARIAGQAQPNAAEALADLVQQVIGEAPP